MMLIGALIAIASIETDRPTDVGAVPLPTHTPYCCIAPGDIP